MRDRYTAPLLKQITLISSVNHPNIVNFHGAYLSAHSREVHVITEFCGGGSLKTVGANISRLGLVIPGDKAMSHIINGVIIVHHVALEKLLFSHETPLDLSRVEPS